jgi:hypothetical protein
MLGSTAISLGVGLSFAVACGQIHFCRNGCLRRESKPQSVSVLNRRHVAVCGLYHMCWPDDDLKGRNMSPY